MIELPNGKISRTLPEQVGFLSEQVQRIFRFLDGINVQDNVVVVDNIATPLTAEELVIANRDVAFLVYSGQLYIKKSVSGSTAYFDVVFSISAGTTITFNSSEIQVNLSNGGMSLVTNSPATYSKAQIDTLLSAKSDITYVDAQVALCAKLAGANFTGAITAPSIIQNMSGFSVDKTTLPTGVHIDYAGIVQNGNKLTFVQAGHIEASGQAAGAFSLWGFNIPNDIGTKLYPLGGTTNIDVRNLTLFKEGAITSSQQPYAFMTKNSNVYLRMGIYTTSSLDATGTYHFRYEVTFLLSDNLAS